MDIALGLMFLGFLFGLINAFTVIVLFLLDSFSETRWLAQVMGTSGEE